MVNMNRLSTQERARIVGALVEGNSLRATSRMTGAAKNTITKLLVDIGQAAADYQDDHLRLLPCEVVEADEIWAYCYAKNKNVPEQFKGTPGYGDVWTFTADLRRHEAGPDLAGRRAHRRRCRSLSRATWRSG